MKFSGIRLDFETLPSESNLSLNDRFFIRGIFALGYTHYSPCRQGLARKSPAMDRSVACDVCFARRAFFFAPTREMKMRNAFVIAGIFALATALNSTATLAQSGGGGMSAMGSASGSASAQADASLSGTRSLGGISHAGGKNSIRVATRANVDGRRSLARADIAAGSHVLKGRNIARTRGANKTGFCPPGQAKKPGLGSRFEC